MNIYIVDAFTSQLFSGNQAGVVVLESGEDYPSDQFMRQIAAELKHSETAFVKQLSPNSFKIRYFTPVEEVDLCGHATIASFTVLREEQLVTPGYYNASTPAGTLRIDVQGDCIWMEMAAPRTLRSFTRDESLALYQAYGLDLSHQPTDLVPKVVSTGLSDILLPVNSRHSLENAVLNAAMVSSLSSTYDAVGFHLFYASISPDSPPAHEPYTAHCRNFAPLFGIDEESATGTANGALTFYLYEAGLVKSGDINTFIQGESMGKPSLIKSQLTEKASGIEVHIGGSAVISLKARLWKHPFGSSGCGTPGIH